MITVEHLTKRYGDFTAVNDLSFEIDEGHVYGFLGPNGAGKSTTMNIMTGCLSATGGHVRIDGHDIFEEPDRAKRLMGYLPEQPPLYMNETPLEYLRFVGEAKGVKGRELSRQIESVISQTRLGDVRNRLIANLSKGYRQRVGIAQALLGNPRAIILDEPTVGLDPIQIIEIRDLIRQLGQEHTVILSSHILSEVQTICEKVLIITKGKLAAFDEPENLEKLLTASSAVSFIAEAEADEIDEILEGMGAVEDWRMQKQGSGGFRVDVTIEFGEVSDVCRSLFFAFAQRGKALLELTSKKASLEDVFLELTECGADVTARDNYEGSAAPAGSEKVRGSAAPAESEKVRGSAVPAGSEKVRESAAPAESENIGKGMDPGDNSRSGAGAAGGSGARSAEREVDGK